MTRAIRLGIDGSNLRLGGGVTHLVELLRAADPAAHGLERVVVWGSRDLLARIAPRAWLDLAHDPLLEGGLARRAYWQQVRLARHARGRCDVLFAPGGSYSGRFAPFVTMSRNLLTFDAAERARYGRLSARSVKLALLRRVQARTMRRAHGVIFLNEYARRTVVAAIGRLSGCDRVIPHGVDPAFLQAPRPQQPEGHYTIDRPFQLLYVSTIELYKHPWHVAEAVAALRRQGRPVSLDLIGSAYPPALARLRETLSRVDPQGRVVRYHGAVPHDELASRYRAADAFVFASSCENMPNILLEAMASGLPIACARRGPMPELLGEGGVYFDPEDAASIEAALVQLFESPARRAAWADAAYTRAQRYSWVRCASDTLAFLCDVASRGNS